MGDASRQHRDYVYKISSSRDFVKHQRAKAKSKKSKCKKAIEQAHETENEITKS